MDTNQRYQQFFNEAPDAIVIFNRDRNVIDTNNAFQELLGYSKEDTKSLKVNDIISAFDQQEIPIIESNLTKNKRIVNKLILHCFDGKQLVAEVSSTLTSENEIMSIIRPIVDDVSIVDELRNSERNLLLAHQKLKLFIDHSTSAVALFDNKMVCLNCSQKWIDDWAFFSTKKIKEEFIGANYFDIFPTINKKWNDILVRALKGEVIINDKELFTSPTGENLWLRWKIHPWHNDQNNVGGVMLFTDIINDEVNTIKALQESEKLNRNLVAHSPMGIVIQNLNQEIVFANPKAAYIVGADKEDDLIGKSIFEFTTHQNTDLIKERVSEMFRTGIPAPFIEQPFIHKDGSYLYGESTIIPFEYKNQPAILSVINDVSEKKKSASLLEQSEEQLRQVLDLVPHSIFAKDEKGNIILANNAFAKYYNTTTDYINKHNDLPPSTRPDEKTHKEFLKIDQQVISSKKAVTTPVESQTDSNNNVRYIQTTKVPYTGEKDTSIKLLGISLDITERIENEVLIQKSDDRHRALLSAIPDLMFINSVDGIYLDSHALSSKLLFQPQDFLGKNIKDFFDKDIAYQFLESFKNAKTNEPQVVQYTLNTNNHPEHFEARIIKYGNDKVLSIIRDVTQQKNDQIALKQSEENLEFYFSKSLDGFYIMEVPKPFKWDKSIKKVTILKKVMKEMRVVKINDSMLNQYGASREEMMGYSLQDFFKHDINKGYEVVMDLLDNGKQQKIIKEQKLDGTTFWIEGDYVCLYNNDGDIRGLFGFQKDISDRIETEEDLRKITEDLIGSNNELQQFAYLTSHDLRAPVVNLNSLLNFYNKDNPQDKDNPIIIKKIEESVLRLQNTLNDLVNIVALKKQETESEKSVYFSKVTNDVKTSIQTLLSQVEHTVSVEFNVKTIKYPKTHLHSIVQNLLTNAIKYRSTKRALEIGIKTYNHDDYVCLEIRDNGLGIDMNKYGDKLFGIYQRFHNVANSKGLGLYIVKTQVEMMGGYIDVKSKVNQGTTFKIYLLKK